MPTPSISTNTETKVRLIVAWSHNVIGDPYHKLNQCVYKKLTESALRRLERRLGEFIGRWAFAYVVPAGGSTLKLWYYHPNESTNGIPNRLDRGRYTKAMADNGQLAGNYFLWLIPTTTYKDRTGQQRLPTTTVNSIDDVSQHFNKNVLRIDVYQNKVKVGEYDRQGYRVIDPDSKYN